MMRCLLVLYQYMNDIYMYTISPQYDDFSALDLVSGREFDWTPWWFMDTSFKLTVIWHW